jgi:hypothetical protein
MTTDVYWFHSHFGETAMRKRIGMGICVALLAGAIVAPAHGQTAAGSPQKNGSDKSTGNAQTNGTDGQRKSGQVVHQDFSKVQASKPAGLSPAATPANQGTTQGSNGGNGGGNSAEKEKFRQEFGPTQVNKKNDAIAPSGSGGKPKTGVKMQSPK